MEMSFLSCVRVFIAVGAGCSCVYCSGCWVFVCLLQWVLGVRVFIAVGAGFIAVGAGCT